MNGAKILEVLQRIYGDGGMVDACSRHITRMLVIETSEGENLERALHMELWNWFPGGDTALYAAREVLAALDKNDG